MAGQGRNLGGTEAISPLLSKPLAYEVTPTPPARARPVKMNRSLVEKAPSRGGGFSRRPPNGPGMQGESFSTSSDDRDASFRKRQAGLLASEGMGLSALKIGVGEGRGGDEDGGGGGGDGGSGRGVGRRGSSIMVTPEEVEVSLLFCDVAFAILLRRVS